MQYEQMVHGEDKVQTCEAHDSPLQVFFRDVTGEEHVSEQWHRACIRALDETPALQCNPTLPLLLQTVSDQDAKGRSLQSMPWTSCMSTNCSTLMKA